MAVQIFSAGNFGWQSTIIKVEADLTPGLYSFTIVGLPDPAINEAKQRINAAIKNSGLKPPKRSQRLVINLAPADIKKQGPAYDLPMALGFLSADNQIKFNPKNKLFVGELSLNGQVAPINGVLPIALKTNRQHKIRQLYVPEKNALEAAVVNHARKNSKLKIYPVKSLKQLIAHLQGKIKIKPQKPVKAKNNQKTSLVDMSLIKGQEQTKRALEIAAAGGHNILLVGPPGCGKSLLAKTLPTILPKLALKESLIVSRIYSLAGELPPKQPLIRQRPFRSPHHSASQVALVGGGTWPSPGEISLAHKGVLFLDELAEFPRQSLESLRQPLENKEICIARSQYKQTWPADFMLVAATNPCPCGYYGDEKRPCQCTMGQIARYQRKISGPLLDRIDLQVKVPAVDYKNLTNNQESQTSQSVQKRVQIAYNRQKRLRNRINSQLNLSQIEKFCTPDKAGQKLLKKAMEQDYISARGYHRLLKIARTIADLQGQEKIKTQHIAEALQYRLSNDLI